MIGDTAVAVFLGAIVFLYLLARVGAGTVMRFVPPQTVPGVSLDPALLPYYAARSTLRMFVALAVSLVFTLVYGYAAARSRKAERVLIPLLDILQSVPVLGFLSVTVDGFIALFPGSLLGLEAAAIFAIFTAQAWNMTFSFYQSLRTLPRDLQAVEMRQHHVEYEGIIRPTLRALQTLTPVVRYIVVTLLSGLTVPHSVAYHNGRLYVAEEGRVTSYRYDAAQVRLYDAQTVIASLPTGGRHVTRTIAFGPDGALYISVGSSCNECVDAPTRAVIMRYRADGTGGQVYARGLRNAVGLAWQRGTGRLWASENGRDFLGDNIPPD